MVDDKTIIADAASLSFLKQGSKKKDPCLVQYNGSKLGKRYPLMDTVSIVGRTQDVQVFISEASVSRQHGQFIKNGDIVFFEDLKSSNGSFVNDIKTEGQVKLKDGDIIRLGTVLLKFFAHDNVDSIMHDKIYQMATIDAGTQIFNKQYLFDTLESELRYSKTYGKDLSIIYYDLDKFKPVNDTYGHNAGDYILKESAKVVKEAIRKDDTLGRFGGEEFIIILPSTDIKMAADLAERIRLTHEHYEFMIEYNEGGELKKVSHRQTISMGVSQLTNEMSEVKQLLEDADKKLYHSKNNGRNQVTV